MITFHKSFASQYEFRFFGENAPIKAGELSLTGTFRNSIMQSVRLVVSADMQNPWNKGIKLQASRNMTAKLIRAARSQSGVTK